MSAVEPPIRWFNAPAPILGVAISFLSIEDARNVGQSCRHLYKAARAAEAYLASEIPLNSNYLQGRVHAEYMRLFPGLKPQEVLLELRTECDAAIQRLFATEQLKKSGAFTFNPETEQALNELLHVDSIQEDAHALRRFALFYHEYREKMLHFQIRQEDDWALGNKWGTAEITMFQGIPVDPGVVFTREERWNEVQKIRSAYVHRLETVSKFIMHFFLQEKTAYVYTQHFLPTARGHKDLLVRFWQFQKNAARETRGGHDRVRNFKLNHLEEVHPLYALHSMERIIFDYKAGRDEQLLNFCGSLARRGLPIPGATAAEKRAWLNDPQNEAALCVIDLLWLDDYSDIPREIGRLKRLKTLIIGSSREANRGLRYLPEELAQLTSLSVLRISDSDFNELPPVLGRIPSLSTLEIWHNGGLIPMRLTDKIARNSQATSFFMNCALNFPLNMYYNRSSIEYLGLNSERLTHIPFFMWFRQECTLPSVDLSKIGDLIKPLADALSSRLVAFCGGEICQNTFAAIISTAIQVIWTVITIVPILLYDILTLPINLFLIYAIEPIVTLIRDRLGYSREVQIH